MLLADSVEAFLEAPLGRYVRGQAWLYACIDEGLFAQIYYGRPTGTDVEPLTQAWQVELLPGAVKHVGLVDAAGLEGMDPGWLDVIRREMSKNGKLAATKITQQALVRPPGLTGMLVAGFYGVVTPTYAVKVFAELAESLDWLGRSDALAKIVALRAELRRDGELLDRLREHIVTELSSVTLASAAHALALSQRTLQRRLRDANTNFQQILISARVRAAETLLEAGDRKLADIAQTVGFSSAQHFSDAFRRVHGVAPSAWRKKPAD